MGDRDLHQFHQKPAREEWFHWAQVVIDRLTTCVRTYSHPPHEDAFMSDSERQAKNTRTLDLLRRIHALTDEAETPTDSLDDVDHHDERVIAGLKVLLRDTLALLPELSADMQKLLKSHWMDKFSDHIARDLFRGPLGREAEGIGSGFADHGRLPQSLENLLEREQLGDTRPPREAVDQPHRHTQESHTRWADKNSQYLRSAGRVE